jgi:hypothetical protein
MLKETRQRNVQMASVISRDVNAEIGNIIGRMRIFTERLEEIDPSLESQAIAMLGLRLSSPEYRGVYYFDVNGHILLYHTDTMQNLSAQWTRRTGIPFYQLSQERGCKRFKAVEGNNVYVSDVYYTPGVHTRSLWCDSSLFLRGDQMIVSEIALEKFGKNRDIYNRANRHHLVVPIILYFHPSHYLGRQIPVEVAPYWRVLKDLLNMLTVYETEVIAWL